MQTNHCWLNSHHLRQPLLMPFKILLSYRRVLSLYQSSTICPAKSFVVAMSTNRTTHLERTAQEPRDEVGMPAPMEIECLHVVGRAFCV
jgi:hypothetical protein